LAALGSESSSSSFGHPVGTCRIGIDGMTVAEPKLRVHGIQNLRVADSSDMLSVPTAPTNAAPIMIGGKAVALLPA
jgi:choline dehydrogenase